MRGAHVSHRRGRVESAYVLEFSHRHSDPPAATSRIAATMLGSAPHRQMLPLVSSRISSSDPAVPSSTCAMADMICPGVQ
jgi:hypothetical protein